MGTYYAKKLEEMGNSFELRNSARFHHPRFKLTDRFFATTQHNRIKAYVSVPIRLGATATKNDFIQDGEDYYVHAGAIKSQGIIEIKESGQVTPEFYERNRRRFGLKPGDLVVSRSGEGTIGKAGLYISDDRAVFSDFTMRLRFRPTMNPRFAWYYFRSAIFQMQVQREKSGMGNMTNIFPRQVERMLIVDCPRSRQDRVQNEISVELEKLTRASALIERKRDEIDRMISEATVVT